MKRRIIEWLVMELFIAFFMGSLMHGDRADEIQAYIAFRENPNPETTREVNHLKWVSLGYRLVVSGAIYIVMTSITIPLLIVRARRKRIKEQQISNTKKNIATKETNWSRSD